MENFLRSVSKTPHFSITHPNTKDDIQQYVLSTFENLFSDTFLFFSLNTFFYNALELYFFNVTLEYVFFNGPCFSYFFTSFLFFIISPKGKPFVTRSCISPSDSEPTPRMTFLCFTSSCTFALGCWMPFCSNCHYLHL